MTHLVCTWRRTPHGTFSKPSSLATDDYEARNSSTRLGKCQVNPSEPSGQHTWHTTWRTTWHTMWGCAGDDRCRRPGLGLAQPNCHAANRSARGTAPRHDIWKALPVLSVSLIPAASFTVCPKSVQHLQKAVAIGVWFDFHVRTCSLAEVQIWMAVTVICHGETPTYRCTSRLSARPLCCELLWHALTYPCSTCTV